MNIAIHLSSHSLRLQRACDSPLYGFGFKGKEMHNTIRMLDLSVSGVT
jgi:hypothetical protein